MPIAILDLGSARAKLAITTMHDGEVLISTAQVDTFFSDPTADRKGLEGVDALLKKARRAGCERLLCFGTEFFRSSPPNASWIKEEVERLVGGAVAELRPATEARLFYKAARSVVPAKILVAMDVGGGSLQLCWADSESGWLTAKLGTFEIEKRFQTDLEESIALGSEVHREIVSAVQQSFQGVVAKVSGNPVLAVGSNIMADFFGYILEEQGLAVVRGVNMSEFVSGSAESLLKIISGRSYDELENLYPDNPKFMRGADKLLIVLCCVANMLRSSTIVATNESVSRELGRIVHLQPEWLEEAGLPLRPFPPA